MMQTYKRAPVEFVLGEGATLYDRDGEAYLDFLAGISVCNAGHCHPHVVEAVRQQAARLFHVSNLFYTEPGVRLAERLAESFRAGARVFLATRAPRPTRPRSSSPASTAAAARSSCSRTPFTAARWARCRRRRSATKQEPFAPLVPGFVVVPRNDPSALAAAVGDGPPR